MFSCEILLFDNSANLICRSTDISKCFSGCLRDKRVDSIYILQDSNKLSLLAMLLFDSFSMSDSCLGD